MILPKIKNNPRTTDDERKLEDYLQNNISLIEEGMTFIDRQVPVDHGFIDIVARDKNGSKCVIELKSVNNDKRLPYQCLYYPTQIKGNTRMLVVAPDYREDMLVSLNKLDVELYTYEMSNDDYIINRFGVR
ncbi:hypothetical protein AN161_17970 [Lysinibacillus sp. FJAT-14222]|nr:hypothetical protein AN161_17970 [Lysinibacillus sp. FJAT-14222]